MTSFVLPNAEEAPASGVIEQILPTVRALDGYRGMVVLSDVEGGRIVAMSLWETAEKMAASRYVTEKIQAAETVGRNIESQDEEKFRVVAFDLSA